MGLTGINIWGSPNMSGHLIKSSHNINFLFTTFLVIILTTFKLQNVEPDIIDKSNRTCFTQSIVLYAWFKSVGDFENLQVSMKERFGTM